MGNSQHLKERPTTLVIWSSDPPEMAFLLREVRDRFPETDFGLLLGRHRDRLFKEEGFASRHIHSMQTKRFRILRMDSDLPDVIGIMQAQVFPRFSPIQ